MKILRLKEFRLRANLTQSEISKRMDLSQSYYSRLELGKHVPDANQILQLCKILNCSPNDLFGIHGTQTVAISPLYED